MKKTKSYKALLAAEPNLSAFLTLFSFGTMARAAQFLVPLFIYSAFLRSKELDFYFYWTVQSALVATFLGCIWPAALQSVLVKSRSVAGEIETAHLAKTLLLRFALFTSVIAVIFAFFAYRGLLGGPDLSSSRSPLLLLGLFFTILCSALSIAISEVAAAQRKFALIYQAVLASAMTQICILIYLKHPLSLEISFLLASLAQLMVSLFRSPISIGIFLAPSHNLKIAKKLLPSTNSILLLYLGGVFTTLTAHLSFRLMVDEQVGVISAFAMASMLALAPQQLLIQPLSTVAGIAMTETFNSKSNEFNRISKNWRDRMFRLSLFLGFSLGLISLISIILLPYFSWSQRSWTWVAAMTGFLSLPLAISGLNNWISRLTVSTEKLNAGVLYQIMVNLWTIALLFLCSIYSLPFSSAVALSISALIQFFSIPFYQRIISPSKHSATV